MIEVSDYIPKFKQFGYEEKQNISDFWFSKKDELGPQLIKESEKRDIFSLAVRWESDIGVYCLNAIKLFIRTIQDKNTQERNELHKQGMVSFDKAVIDFQNLRFYYQGKEYDLQKFSVLFETSQIFGRADLRGIDLSGIRIGSALIRNAFFSYSNFSNSVLQQIELVNTNFVRANFFNARLALVRLDDNSTFSNANFSNAFLNAIDFTDKNISEHIIYNEIPYFTLLAKTVGIERKNRNHTEFALIDTKSISDFSLENHKRYIQWYMNVTNKIRNTRGDITKRASILFQVFISKYWSSYEVFGAITALTILILSGIFYNIRFNFKVAHELGSIHFFDAIYFVVVTFTTLGYGDISPISWVGQVFVIFTALSGYVFLAVFIYLLSKKLN
jgi:uncharacterized protein YjbI with pentapeptide repeats